MKKRIALIFLSILIYCQGNSQNKKWAVEGSYGLNFNFFVPNYNENYAPTNHLYLYKKNVTGGARSIELKFKATPYASIFAGY